MLLHSCHAMHAYVVAAFCLQYHPVRPYMNTQQIHKQCRISRWREQSATRNVNIQTQSLHSSRSDCPSFAYTQSLPDQYDNPIKQVGTWAEMVSVTWLKDLILAHDIMVPTITSTNPFPSNSYISWSVSLDNGSGPDHLTWKWSQLKDKDLKQDDDQIPHIILSPVPDDHAKITSLYDVPTNRVFLKFSMFNGCLW